jgi:hypothetical protein
MEEGNVKHQNGRNAQEKFLSIDNFSKMVNNPNV